MGIFGNIFNKKKRLEPVDLSILKTDLHSHLIPGIDDGSKSMDDTLNMLRKFSELGYKKVITTPHIMSDFYRNNPEIILGGLEKVRIAKEEAGIQIEIEAAAEYYLDEYFRELIEKNELLTFGDNHVLFELSFAEEPPRVKDTIFSLVTEGYHPIMAHIERYPYYIEKWDVLEDFKDRGCLLQLNINSLSGHYGPHIKKWAAAVIDRGIIDIVGLY
ncbi:MAG: capsular biosynthesis protein [Crocinitomicaceae bacterium]|nr:capsular biosynthesis protein [Crocinitomicaceae bacterium]